MMSSSSRRSSIGSSNISNRDGRRRSGLLNRSGAGDCVLENEGDGDGMVKIPIIGYEVMEERARFTVSL